MKTKLQMRAGTAIITIYDDINAATGFSLQDLQNELKKLSPETPLEIRISSDGGDVFQGLGIYNLLSQWKGEVTTICDGIAGSIAAIIFLAGKNRKIADSAFLMTHDANVSARGKQLSGLKDLVSLVEKAGQNFREIMASRTGAKAETVEQWLTGDNWFTAQEAVAAGLATEIIGLDSHLQGANFISLAAKLQRIGVTGMFQTWLKEHCELLGLDETKLSADQRTKLEATYNKTIPKPPKREQKQIENDEDPQLEAKRVARETEENRIEEIRTIADGIDFQDLNETYLSDTLKLTAKTMRAVVTHAIKNKWSTDKFELEMSRATKPDLGHVGIHSKESPFDEKDQVFVAAIVRSAGVPASKTQQVTGKKYGYEHWFDEQTLNASDNPNIRDISLSQLLERNIAAAHGRRAKSRYGTDSFIEEVRQAQFSLRASGNTTWTGLNIFQDAANKMLWSAYEAQNTTWQEWVKVMSVNDFKTHNAYRLTGTGGYRLVGPDGELKHGGFTDQKFTHAAKTYGKIVGLSRTDLINDDMGALNGIMTMLGSDGAKFLEELFYVHLLNQLTTLFPTNNANGNYLSGAGSDLGVDGMTAAQVQISNHVDAANQPILTPASILMHGNQDAVLAGLLYTQGVLQGLQTANAKKTPDSNPHVGSYRPVKAGYLSNSNIKQRVAEGSIGAAVPNQNTDQWLLLRAPGPEGGLVIGSFLYGQQRPTIQQADSSFEVLGLQWRAFHDAGADNGDPKWGQYNAGA